MSLICGMDEVGRGALAGPLVLAAVLVDDAKDFESLTSGFILRDSKKMTRMQRQVAFENLVKIVDRFEIEIIDVEFINKYGISKANSLGFLNLANKIRADKYIVDGNISWQKENMISVVKADNFLKPVMAASVIAKITRDAIMGDLKKDFPEFGFEKHVGYGTLCHIEAIKKYGLTKHHRHLFVRNIISKAAAN